MISLQLVLWACGLLAVSGLPGLFLDRRAPVSQTIATVLALAGAALGLLGAAANLTGNIDARLTLPAGAGLTGSGPSVGGMEFGLDTLSAFFLIPVFLLGGLGSIYGLGYWKQTAHPRTGRKLGAFYGLMVAGIALVMLARHAILFLFAWEIMAFSAFFLIATNDHEAEVCDASRLYLITTRVATLCLFVMFALLRKAGGSFTLRPLAETEAGLGLLTVIFLLAVAGFGLKAGLMPLHVWLPAAHGKAPSHVSALMSGVLIKVGIYGLVRITGLLPNPPSSWGALLLVLGGVSGVLGVAFAIGQHHVKRLLAYHSIENIGIIVMGLGLALAGRSLGRMDWVLLGLGGALLHVWNHGFFKALLFFGAGGIIHAAKTGEIEKLGGLAKPMPYTAGLFLIGATAICGLPPLNGFISELLIYLGLFRALGLDAAVPAWTGAALAAPVLALTGALAAACFIKVYGAAFLGAARSREAASAHESPPSMIGPQTVLAVCCFAIGLFPLLIAPLLERAVAVWAPGTAVAGRTLAALAPLGWIGGLNVALTAACLGMFLAQDRRVRRRAAPRAVTWDCGYAAPSWRMQYTASSFAQMLINFFRWALRPREHAPDIRGLFPRTAHYESHVDDVVLDRLLWPAFRAGERSLAWVHALQQGRTQFYILYVLLMMAALLLWTVPFRDIAWVIFSR